MRFACRGPPGWCVTALTRQRGVETAFFGPAGIASAPVGPKKPPKARKRQAKKVQRHRLKARLHKSKRFMKWEHFDTIQFSSVITRGRKK